MATPQQHLAAAGKLRHRYVTATPQQHLAAAGKLRHRYVTAPSPLRHRYVTATSQLRLSKTSPQQASSVMATP